MSAPVGRPRTQPKRCRVSRTCDRQPICRGLCGLHYQRWWNTGSTETRPVGRPRTQIGACSAPVSPPCTRPKRSKGLCAVHYKHALRSPYPMRPIRARLP